MSKSKIFLILCLGLVVGVFLGRLLNYETMAILAIAFIIVGTVFWDRRLVLILSITGLVMLAGAIRFKLDYAQNDLKQFYGQKVQATGIISEEPDERSDKTYLTLGSLEINGQKLKSKLLITVARFPEYTYGQKIEVQDKLEEPKEFPDFSYKNYLSRFGIDATMYRPKITLITGQFGNPVKLAILNFKKKFVGNLALMLPEPQNSFLGGLLLGAKHSIPDWLTNEFNLTGTSHIVAVSGYNITIIAAGIDWVLAWLGLRKRLAFLCSLSAILVFVIMTGATASVVRAGIMGSLLLIALNIGRLNVISNSLAFTAAIMLLINPQILAFDVGFQLSFAALIGIVYIVPLIDRYFLWLPNPLREYFLATLAAQIFTLPILMYNFGQLSVVAIAANILVLPLVPITMLFGFLSGLMALVYRQLAIPFVAITWLLLTYIIKVIGFFASLPFAALTLTISPWAITLYYVIIVFVIISWYQKDLIINRFSKWKTKPKNF